jgi:hypothetical protein
MDATMARWHGYRLADAVFYVVFCGVFPAFCDERGDGPYLTRFVADRQHFLWGGYRPHDDGWDARRCGPTENEPEPPPRPHETVAVSPSPAFTKALASSGPCE